MLKNLYINGYPIPIDNVINLKFTQSLHFMIKGEISFLDTGFKDDILEKTDNILLMICHDKMNDIDLGYQFVIYSNPDTEKDSGNLNINTTILFTNKGVDAIMSKRVTSTYYDQTSISDLFEISAGEIGIHLDNIDNTNLKVDYKLYDSLESNLKWFMNYSADINNNSGYVFYYDINSNKYNYVSLLNLWNSKIIDEYEYPILHNSTNVDYIGLASKLVIQDDVDILDMINYGIVNTKVSGFDYDTGESFIDDSVITDLIINLNLNIPLDKKYLESEYSKCITINGKSKEMIEIYKNNKYISNCINISRIKVYLPNGDYNRVIGQMIPIAIEKSTGDGKVFDKTYTGKYLITKIEHMWQGKDYQQVLLINRFGIAKENDNFIGI